MNAETRKAINDLKQAWAKLEDGAQTVSKAWVKLARKQRKAMSGVAKMTRHTPGCKP